MKIIEYKNIDIIIETVKHNGHIIIKSDYGKQIYIDYTESEAIEIYKQDYIDQVEL